MFTTYNSSLDVQIDRKIIDLVTVGNKSYNKVNRSLAILNVFIDFIQVNICLLIATVINIGDNDVTSNLQIMVPF